MMRQCLRLALSFQLSWSADTRSTNDFTSFVPSLNFSVENATLPARRSLVPSESRTVSRRGRRDRGSSSGVLEGLSNAAGIPCEDNSLVEQFGVKCTTLARNVGPLGCEKLLADLVIDQGLSVDSLPPIYRNRRVADACPASCGLCEQCSPGCARWFIGNGFCEKACNVPTCQFDGGDCWVVDCVVSNWSEWSECSLTCDPTGNGGEGGVEERTRTVLVKPINGGKPCPTLSDTRTGCNASKICPVGCEVGPWLDWGACSPACGPGQGSRKREILKPAEVGGAECPELTQSRPCFNQTCSSDCEVSDWSDWTLCASVCGTGVRHRRRTITQIPTLDGQKCPALEAEETCDGTGCIAERDSIGGQQVVDAHVPSVESCNSSNLLDWSDWSDCDVPCGGGKSRRIKMLKSGVDPASCTNLNPATYQQTMICNAIECVQECQMSEWSVWSECSEPCAGSLGTQSRSRTLKKPPSPNGLKCPVDVLQSRPCIGEPCRVDCDVGVWSSWSACLTEQSCGPGVSVRSRSVIQNPQLDGSPCPSLAETRECSVACSDPDPASLNCVFTEWGNWSECSALCGIGTSTRNRQLTSGGDGCGPLTEVIACYGASGVCSEDCVVSPWSDWSVCSVGCGGGTTLRTRTPTTFPRGNGKSCPELVDSKTCNETKCDLDCVVSEWSDWTPCSATCGSNSKGKRTRTRSTLQKAVGDGAACPPDLSEEGDCRSPGRCPTNCVLSMWSDWGPCSEKCGIGEKVRTRQVVKKAADGGIPCPPTSDRMSCFEKPCVTKCEVSNWTAWTDCSAPCDGGQSVRTREILTKPSNGGDPCPELWEYKTCNETPCSELDTNPSDCQLDEWSSWSPCTAECGGGVHNRTRTVLKEPLSGGKPCGELLEISGCGLSPCAGPCRDNADVSKMTGGATCAILKALGCSQSLKNLATQNGVTFPAWVPPEARVLDACPMACGYCTECSHGCQRRQLGNTVCDAVCNNAECEFDLGDCGGDCKIPPLGDLRLMPPTTGLALEATVNATCRAAGEVFEAFPSLSTAQIVCRASGGKPALALEPASVFFSRRSPSGDPTRLLRCAPDSCASVAVTGFTDEFQSLNGIYNRSPTGDGRTHFVREDWHLWADDSVSFISKSDSTFAWRLTSFRPSTKSKNKSISAAATGDGCNTPADGQDAPLTCVSKLPWFVGSVTSSAPLADLEHRVNGISIGCASEEDILGFVKAEVPRNETRPYTFLNIPGEEPRKTFCEDQHDVQTLSGFTCDKLKSLLGCDFVIADSGKPLPSWLPKSATVATVCPASCNQCKECAAGCPTWFKSNKNCDASCNNQGCDFDGGDCKTDVVAPCVDDPMVTKMGYSCELLIALSDGLNKCDTKILDVAAHNNKSIKLPHGIPNTVRVLDACPKSCNCCSCQRLTWTASTSPPPKGSTCVDNPIFQQVSGYSCSQVVGMVGDCDVFLSDLGSVPSGVPPKTKLKDACPKSCKVCVSDTSDECEDNSLIEKQSGQSCAEVVKFIGDCSTRLADLGELPQGIPKEATLAMACPKSCGTCGGSITPTKLAWNGSCRDNAIVETLGYSCVVLLQFAPDGCKSLLSDLMDRHIPGMSNIEDACPATCGTCAQATTGDGDGRCEDNPIVSKLNATCPLMIKAGAVGCNTLITDLTENALARKTQQGKKVRDLCPSSCGLCQQPTCFDGFQNGYEDGVDCGGICRPCRWCSPAGLKAMGIAYSFEGHGIGHNSTRSVRCASTYSNVGAASEGELLVCQDGSWSKAKLVCGPKQMSVFTTQLQLSNADDFDASTLSAILGAFNTGLSLAPPNEVRLDRAGVCGEFDKQGSGIFVCADSAEVRQTGFDCSTLSSLGCSTLLGDLARKFGASLPTRIPAQATVGDACPVTCNSCALAAERLAQLDPAKAPSVAGCFRVDAMMRWTGTPQQLDRKVSKAQKDFTFNLVAQFAARQSTDIGTIARDGAAITKLRPVTMTAATPVSATNIAIGKWKDLFSTNDDDTIAASILVSAGLPIPQLSSASLDELGPTKVSYWPFSSNNPNPSFEYAEAYSPLDPVIAPVVSFVGGSCSNGGHSACCQMENDIGSFISGSCGNVLYGRKVTQEDMAIFCRSSAKESNPCLFRALELIESYEKKSLVDASCSMVKFAKSLILSWCSRDGKNSYEPLVRLVGLTPSLASSSPSSRTLLQDAARNVDDPVPFCFPSFEIYAATRLDLRQLATKRDRELDPLCQKDGCFRHFLRYADALSQIKVGWAAGLSSKKSSRSNRLLEESSSSWFLARGFGHVLNQSAASSPLRRLTVVGDTSGMREVVGDFSEDLLDVGCLKVDGKYCQQSLMVLTEDNPVHDPALLQNPCDSPCFTPLTGRLGSIVQAHGLRINDPYQKALGSLMRSYGRFYCMTNAKGQKCGSLLAAMLRNVVTPPYVPSGVKSTKSCSCSASFVQDGQCDAECFNADCNFDGEDCLASRMFPDVYEVLSSSFSEECSPFNPHFTCSRDCRSALERTSRIQGCCFTASLEALGDLLEVDTSNPKARKLTAQRSAAFVEQTCGVSLDRTCSSGVPFERLTSEIAVRQVDLPRDLQSPVDLTIKRAMAQLLQLTDRDVVRQTSRAEGEYWISRLEMDVATPQSRAKAEQFVNNPASPANVEAVVSRRLQALSPSLFHVEVSRSTLTKVSAPPFSTTAAPPVPFEGTWGFTKDLPRKGCELDTYFDDNPAFGVAPGESEDGKVRKLTCGYGHFSTAAKEDHIRCANGAWTQLGDLQCKQSCISNLQSPKTLNLTNGYSVTKTSFLNVALEGDFQVLVCAAGFTAVGGIAPAQTSCLSGSWTFLPLECRQECQQFDTGDHEAFVVSGMGQSHGSTRAVLCAIGYFPTPPLPAQFGGKVTSTCLDGNWAPLPMTCVKPHVIDPNAGPSPVSRVMSTLFNGPGLIGFIVVGVLVIIIILAICFAWKIHFKSIASSVVKDRKLKMDEFKDILRGHRHKKQIAETIEAAPVHTVVHQDPPKLKCKNCRHSKTPLNKPEGGRPRRLASWDSDGHDADAEDSARYSKDIVSTGSPHRRSVSQHSDRCSSSRPSSLRARSVDVDHDGSQQMFTTSVAHQVAPVQRRVPMHHQALSEMSLAASHASTPTARIARTLGPICWISDDSGRVSSCGQDSFESIPDVSVNRVMCKRCEDKIIM